MIMVYTHIDRDAILSILFVHAYQQQLLSVTQAQVHFMSIYKNTTKIYSHVLTHVLTWGSIITPYPRCPFTRVPPSLSSWCVRRVACQFWTWCCWA